MLPATRLILRSLVAKNSPLLSRCYHEERPHHVPATMNDLPVPQGDWQEANQKKQRKYNMFLISSFVFFVTTLSIVKESELIHLNWAPPKTYE